MIFVLLFFHGAVLLFSFTVIIHFFLTSNQFDWYRRNKTNQYKQQTIRREKKAKHCTDIVILMFVQDVYANGGGGVQTIITFMSGHASWGYKMFNGAVKAVIMIQ